MNPSANLAAEFHRITKERVAGIVKDVGIAGLLAATGDCIRDTEQAVRSSHDSTLAEAFLLLLPCVTAAYPRATQKQQRLIEMVLGSIPVSKALQTTNARSKGQCRAVSECIPHLDSIISSKQL